MGLDDLNLNNFMKLAMWQLWSGIGPLGAGLLRVVAFEVFTDFTTDIKYGMPVAGVARFEDLFSYLMNMILYTFIFDTLGVTYTDDEFVELDFDSFASV